MLKVLRLRDFRLLWLGQGISLLGDQFYFVALPWLVLQLTGNALAMGTVLGLAGVPRAVFVLLGGALTDRLSARFIMLTSNVLRLVLVAFLAALVLTNNIALWMLYIFALTFGLVDAFFYPASSAILPRIVELDDLQAANSLYGATAQISFFLGPVLAGAMIALLAGGTGVAGEQAVPDHQGIGIAFAVDAISFLCSAITLWLMHLKRRDAQPSVRERQSFWLDIREGLLFAWKDPALRIVLLLVAAINLCAMGPFAVGIPVLANSRLARGRPGLWHHYVCLWRRSVGRHPCRWGSAKACAESAGTNGGADGRSDGPWTGAARVCSHHGACCHYCGGDGRGKRLSSHTVRQLAAKAHTAGDDGADNESGGVRGGGVGPGLNRAGWRIVEP